ncbi:MAG: hypothetical protein AABX16_03425 [Nanoarchaeota archaeon]
MGKSDEHIGLADLKKSYEVFAKKYTLPAFEELNHLFEIEEISGETDLLLKRIRHVIIEKISNYFRFVDLLINPSSSSLFFYKKVKKLTNPDREFLSEVYELLGDLEIESVLRDLDYVEQKEALFIKKIYTLYNKTIKKRLMQIVESVISFAEKETFMKNSSGSYFG